MKKEIVVLLIVCTLGTITGCSNSNKKETSVKPSSVEIKKEDVKKETNTQTLDGLTLSVTSKLEPMKGDRTKDNVSDPNGEYIADGSDIVKASDYKKIVVSINVKNDSDKSVDVGGLLNWSAELQDGYKLKRSLDYNEKDSQIQSKASGKYEVYFNVKNDIKADKIKLTYLWIKNQEEFKKLLSDPNLAKMSEEEAKEKYKDIYCTIKLETDIQK